MGNVEYPQVFATGELLGKERSTNSGIGNTHVMSVPELGKNRKINVITARPGWPGQL